MSDGCGESMAYNGCGLSATPLSRGLLGSHESMMY